MVVGEERGGCYNLTEPPGRQGYKTWEVPGPLLLCGKGAETLNSTPFALGSFLLDV